MRSYNFADVNKAIQLGQAAMAIQWASGAKPMEDKTKSTVAGKLGYTRVPKAVRQTPMRGVWTIAIAKNSANQDAAWQFATWLSGKEFGKFAVTYPSATSAIHSPRGVGAQGSGHAGGAAVRRRAARQPADHQGAAAAARVRRHPGESPGDGRQAHGRRADLDAALKEIDAGTNRILGK